MRVSPFKPVKQFFGAQRKELSSSKPVELGPDPFSRDTILLTKPEIDLSNNLQKAPPNPKTLIESINTLLARQGPPEGRTRLARIIWDAWNKRHPILQEEPDPTSPTFSSHLNSALLAFPIDTNLSAILWNQSSSDKVVSLPPPVNEFLQEVNKWITPISERWEEVLKNVCQERKERLLTSFKNIISDLERGINDNPTSNPVSQSGLFIKALDELAQENLPNPLIERIVTSFLEELKPHLWNLYDGGSGDDLKIEEQVKRADLVIEVGKILIAKTAQTFPGLTDWPKLRTIAVLDSALKSNGWDHLLKELTNSFKGIESFEKAWKNFISLEPSTIQALGMNPAYQTAYLTLSKLLKEPSPSKTLLSLRPVNHFDKASLSYLLKNLIHFLRLKGDEIVSLKDPSPEAYARAGQNLLEIFRTLQKLKWLGNNLNQLFPTDRSPKNIPLQSFFSSGTADTAIEKLWEKVLPPLT